MQKLNSWLVFRKRLKPHFLGSGLSEDKSFVYLKVCLLLVCGFVVTAYSKGILV